MNFDRRGRWSRWDKKKTVGNYLRLDITKIAKEIGLDRPATYDLAWPRTNTVKQEHRSSITITVHPGQGLQLRYAVNGQDIEPYIVSVVYTTPNYGGRRPWFLCPNTHCRRRVRILYGGTYFLCRKCHDLTYRICQESKQDARQRAIRNRMWAIRCKLKAEGGLLEPLPDKPSYMHWKTYEQLVGEYHELNLLRSVAITQTLAALVDVDPSWNKDVGEQWRKHKRIRQEDPDAFRIHYLQRIRHALQQRAQVDDTPDEDANQLTLGELASLAEVPYAFAKEAQTEDLIRPDKGRGKRRKRYRRRLAKWMAKLHTLRDAGLSWAEIRAWTERRWQSGHEHERIWPAAFLSKDTQEE